MGNCQTSMYCCGQNDSTENMGQDNASGHVSKDLDFALCGVVSKFEICFVKDAILTLALV